MKCDVLLPSVIFIIISITVFLYTKYERKAQSIFEGKKFSIRDAVLMVSIMGVIVTLIVFIPNLAIKIVFVVVYSYIISIFAYIVLKKWYLAILPCIIFILTLLFYPNLLILNLFAIVFAIIISVTLGTLFSWKTTLIFALLLTIMDIIQVFVTGFMIQAAEKMVGLNLPIAIMIPTYPFGRDIMLGLGDIFLAGLLAIQAKVKYGLKGGVLTASTIGIAMFIFEILLFNAVFGGIRGFPATIVVILGWLLGIGIIQVIKVKPSIMLAS